MPVAAQAPVPDLGARMLSSLRAAAAGADAACAAGCGGDSSGGAAAAAVAEAPSTAAEATAQPPQPAAAAAPPAAVMVAGTDVPGLTAGVLASAAAALLSGDFDAVVGPARDGGYYLIGMTADLAVRGCDQQQSGMAAAPATAGALFEGIPWSTAGVRAATAAAAARAGLRLGGADETAPLEGVPALADIDTADDLAAWLAEEEEQQRRRMQGGERVAAAGGGSSSDALVAAATAALAARRLPGGAGGS